MDIARRMIGSQIYLSKAFDGLLPEKYRVDGHMYFSNQFISGYLRQKQKVCDIGGGNNPSISAAEKARLQLSVMGIDIDHNQLAIAPAGSYDDTVCSDITCYRGIEDADLVICRTVLEHVKDTDNAFAAIASIIKPGGIALLFVPSRNALYARLNSMLPEEIKKRILFGAFPGASQRHGFPSYYDKCTPKDFRRLAEIYRLEIVEEKYFYLSYYFFIFFPFYLIWRILVLSACLFSEKQAAETFTMALRKKQ